MDPQACCEIFDSPLGAVVIYASDRFILRSCFYDHANRPETFPNGLTKNAFKQLEAYFTGKLTAFSLPLAFSGSPFQNKVWEVVKAIPYGKTATYRHIAEMLGIKNGARAVGMAVAANPLLIFIPCHRVIGASEKLTGYAGGIERKRKLLELERKNAGINGRLLF